jgi:hypothetical protein
LLHLDLKVKLESLDTMVSKVHKVLKGNVDPKEIKAILDPQEPLEGMVMMV